MTEEILDEEQLDGVAGGSDMETNTDAYELYRLGLLEFPNIRTIEGTKFIIDATVRSKVPGLLQSLAKEIGLDIQFKSNANGNNEYLIEGCAVSRQEFWKIIREGLAANKN